nr:immunoglobulin heavy chain junction region [Macaca mulatta]
CIKTVGTWAHGLDAW